MPVELVRSASSRTTVPSAVTSTFDWWLWKSATIAASSGCADPPHATSTAAAMAAANRFIPESLRKESPDSFPFAFLTDLDVARHRGVDRTVILDIARGVEGHEKLGARVTEAGVKGRVVVRRDAVLGGVIDPIPLDRLSLGDGHRRRVKSADRVGVGVDLDDLGCGAARRAALGRAGGGATVATARTAACREHEGAPSRHDCHLPNAHASPPCPNRFTPRLSLRGGRAPPPSNRGRRRRIR